MTHVSRLKWMSLLPAALLILTVGSTGLGLDTAGYHDFAALSQAIKQVASANPSIAKVMSIGKTLQGRDLWMIQISGTKGGSPLDKQALLIVGNLEGDHLIGSEVALGIADQLVKGYGKDETITSALDSRTFYIVPRLNPDGAEAFFADIKEERSANLKPRDEDYDWATDEDGPDDLNGDGMITLMRVKDKDGDWVVDEDDPRLMKRKEADTPFDQLYSVYPEGLDDDGDGRYNEDGPGGFDIDRNFPHNFGYQPRGLNVYPASEVETQALIDFVLAYDPDLETQPHKNICGVLVFSKYDNLAAGTGIESGTPTFPQPQQAAGAAGMRGGRGGMMIFRMGGRRGGGAQEPEPRTPDPQPKRTESRDSGIFKRVSDSYKEITGIKSAVSGKPVGSLLEWAYFQYGVPSFSANLWSLREDAPARPGRKMPAGGAAQARPAQAQSRQSGAEGRTFDRAAMMQRFANAGRTAGAAAQSSDTSDNEEKWLKWIDGKNEGRGFVAWAPFNHKQLGEVEIGGFEPYVRVNPPADQIPELVTSHTDFALDLASRFAEIELAEPVVERLSSNLYRLKLKIKNTGDFPYITAMGARTTQLNSIMLQLKLEDDEDMELFGGNLRRDLSALAPGEEQDYEWTIISPPGKSVDITLWARHGGGTVKKKVVLK